ncbi:hypothetical protein DM860_008749 [Cuscuta australis]|uniref:CAND6/7 N-terminal domain-containing protein n=1 Tax=Cuscuta australis TaxID=267555 RepID=A0A328D9Q7_9ASTE|nr:hypothetical protein DM860_008749 [Cuscuta australis]
MDTPAVVVITFVLSLTITRSPFVAGEIKHTEIRADGRSVISLNEFFFTRGGGQLELNITSLSFLPAPPPDPASLSKIGFVLLPPLTWAKLFNPLTCAFDYPDAHKVLTMDQIPTAASAEWNLLLPSPPPNYRELVFANCLSFELKVSLNVRSAMYNQVESRAGKPPTISHLMGGPAVPKIHFQFSNVYVALGVIWIGHVLLNKNRQHNVGWIHYHMLATLLLKALNLFCEAKQKFYIERTGSATRWLDFWSWTSSIFETYSFCTAMYLIGSLGCTQSQLRLDEFEKFVLFPLLGVSPYPWFLVFALQSSLSAKKKLLVDRANHKRATIVLKKYEAISHYIKQTEWYIFIGLHLEFLFTLSKHSFPTHLALVAWELRTLALYAYTGYMLAPKEDNPDHQNLVINDDEEKAAIRRLNAIDKEEYDRRYGVHF